MERTSSNDRGTGQDGYNLDLEPQALEEQRSYKTFLAFRRGKASVLVASAILQLPIWGKPSRLT